MNGEVKFCENSKKNFLGGGGWVGVGVGRGGGGGVQIRGWSGGGEG